MRRIAVVAGIVTVAIVALAWSWGPGIGAQSGTPETAATLPEGVSLEVIAAGEAATVPPAPVTLSLFRVRLAPGATFSLPADDPGLALISVEAGQLTTRSTVPITVVRTGMTGTPGATEPVAANTTVVLDPGDSFIAPPISGGEYRNEGTEELVGLIAAVEPVESGSAG